MAKYISGDMIVVHIRDVEKDHPHGIPFYEIDPAEDGSSYFDFTEAMACNILILVWK